MTTRSPTCAAAWSVASDDGAIGVLLLLPIVVAAVVATVVATTGAAVLLAEGRAADAADEAAIAAVHARVTGMPAPCEAADRAVASVAGSGRVTACVVGVGGATTVTVVVEVTAPLARRLGVTSVRGLARAAPVALPRARVPRGWS